MAPPSSRPSAPAGAGLPQPPRPGRSAGRRSPDSQARHSLGILGAWLLLTLGVGFLFLGGVRPGVQAGLHLLVAVGCLIAMALPARKLELAGVTLRWVAAGTLLLGALALGLLPVPPSVAAWVAPGTLVARPGAGWTSLATRWASVPAELATASLTIGFGTVAATWAASRHRRAEIEIAVTLVTGLLAVSALAHGLLGATAMLGLVTPVTLPVPFFAPFVNPDHAAAMMVLGGPVAVGVLVSDDHPPLVRGAAGAVVLAGIAVIVWGGSTGAALAAVVVAALWTLRIRGPGFVLLGLVATSAVVAQVWVGRSALWVAGSATVRAELWRNSLTMARDYWLAGTGGGTFGEAIRGYRTDRLLLSFDHAHSEPVEWLTETGAIGVLAAGCALIVLFRGGLRESHRANGILFGIVGLGLHACVDFPLQIPAIAMAGAASLACLIGGFGPQRAASARAVRLALAGVGALQILGAAVEAREAFVARATHAVADFRADPAAAAVGASQLALVHAGGPEHLLYAAWMAEAEGDEAAALAAAGAVRERHPDVPDALSEAALVFARAHHYDEATSILERVTESLPSESGAWVMLGRIAHATGDDQLAARRYSEAFHRGASGFEEAYAAWPLGLYWLQAFGDADAGYSGELAHQLAIEGDLEVALLAWEQAARLDPVGQGDQLVRSSILVRLGRADEAEAWLKELVARRPDDVMVLSEYARVLGVLDRHEEAAAVWLSASRLDPLLRIQALRSAEAAAGPQHALDIARRFETAGTVDGALGLEIAGQHLRNNDPTACEVAIQRWGILNSPLSERADRLLKQCQALER